jgi:hypothetical protein
MTMTPTPSMTMTPTPSMTMTPTPSMTRTPTPSMTRTPTPSMTMTPTPSMTMTPTPSMTRTPTPSMTRTPTPSMTPTMTSTMTPKRTITPTMRGNTKYSPSNELSYPINYNIYTTPILLEKNNSTVSVVRPIVRPKVTPNENSVTPNENSVTPNENSVIPNENVVRPQETILAEFALEEPIPIGSNNINLGNVDTSIFKVGNKIVYDDGTSSTITNIIITPINGFSNHIENFQEDVNVTLILDKPITSETTSMTIVEVDLTQTIDITTPQSYNSTPQSYNATPQSYNATPQSYNATPQSYNATPQSYNAIANTNNNVLSNTDITNITNAIEKKLLDDIVNGINTKFTLGSQCTSYNNEDPNAPQYKQSSRPSSNAIPRENTNNVFQSGNMSVEIPKQYSNQTPGQLPSISESKTKVNFPIMNTPPDMYSYYGALQSKGSDYVSSNAISETNKMLGRLDYVPPPLPPNFDFSYYGALRSKNTDSVKPVNALQGPNPNNYSEKILDEKFYAITGQPGYEELPIPNRIDYTMIKPKINMNNVTTYSSNPIDLYSQYGALVPKDNFYNK